MSNTDYDVILTDTGFFGSLDYDVINALTVGTAVTVTYDGTGGRRPHFYRTVRGTVRRVLETGERGGGELFLEDVTVTHHRSGETLTKVGARLDYRNIMALA